jgi:hypothetical protein
MGGPIVLYLPNSTGNDLQMATVPAPTTTPWTRTWLIERDAGFFQSLVNPFAVLYNSATTTLLWIGGYGNNMYVQRWTSPTNPNSYNVKQQSWGTDTSGAYWIKVSYDGTNVTVSNSKNNIYWNIIGGSSFTLASSGLGAITDIGFGINMASVANPAVAYLWNLS